MLWLLAPCITDACFLIYIYIFLLLQFYLLLEKKGGLNFHLGDKENALPNPRDTKVKGPKKYV